MTEELVQTVIVNLPNFLFAGLGILTLYRLNERLIAMIDRLCEPCDEDAREDTKALRDAIRKAQQTDTRT